MMGRQYWPVCSRSIFNMGSHCIRGKKTNSACQPGFNDLKTQQSDTQMSQHIKSKMSGNTFLWQWWQRFASWNTKQSFSLFLRFVMCKSLQSIQWASHSCRSGSVSADSWCGRTWTASDASPSDVLEEQSSLPHRSLETLQMGKYGVTRGGNGKETRKTKR